MKNLKNSNGISVIALVITIVVIIIITSITVFTGVSVVSDARKKSAEDKLATICNSLRKDDAYMSLVTGDRTLTQQDFDNLDLSSYYDKDYPVVLSKTTTTTNDQIVSGYVLNMYKGDDRSSSYAMQSFMIVEALEKNVYMISFDEVKGVNRPILSENMYALTVDGSAVVEDVYSNSWYDYKSKSTTFAKMKYDTDEDGSITDESVTYVWIPRFAYSIQSYYNGATSPTRSYSDVPASAMKIVFLRENTNYMSNNEVLVSGYQVHPAFSVNGKELAGIWVATKQSTANATLANAISNAASVVVNDAYASSHLMTNSEFSAALYLMFSLGDYEEIDFEGANEFVAAGFSSSATISGLEYADLYVADTDNASGVALKIGDAMIETNWNRTTAVYPTSARPCIVRLLATGRFDFTSVAQSGANYRYRVVIVNK